MSKITDELAERLQSLQPDEMVYVIVGLPRMNMPREGSLQEKIAAKKAAFQPHLESVSQRITELGGNVRASAWINETVAVDMPAEKIHELAENELVQHIDVPGELILEGDEK